MKSSKDIHHTKRDYRTKKRTDSHLGRFRYADNPPASWPAARKGVIRYALVSRGKTYKPNGKRECERRRRQMAKNCWRHPALPNGVEIVAA